MNSKKLTLTCLLAGTLAGVLNSVAQTPVLLLHPTNTTWRYLPATSDPTAANPNFYTEWTTLGYNEDTWGWSTGVGLFGTESTAYPFPLNTPITPAGSGGPQVSYFRAHFTWNGSTDGVVLITTNYIDDGLAWWLNGNLIGEWNMGAQPWVWNVGGAPAANPGGEPVTHRTNLVATGLQTGDNVLCVQVHQNGTTSSDIVFGMWAFGVQQYAPRILLQPIEQTVQQCRSVTLNVVVDAIPAASVQWYKGSDRSNPIPGATTTNLTINNFGLNDEDEYFCVANNGVNPEAESQHVFLFFQADGTPPTPLWAVASADLSTVTVTFDEALLPGANPGAEDVMSYVLRPVDNPGSPLDKISAVLQNQTNVVLTVNPITPMLPGVDYEVVVSGVADNCNNNVMPAAVTLTVSPTVVFQQGLNGYAGTEDTEVRLSAPDTTHENNTYVNVDLQDVTTPGPVNGLLKFNDLIGNNPGQVPPQAVILSATLTLYSHDSTGNADSPGPVRVSRMLAPWSEDTATWNSMVNGISFDDVEAVATPEATLQPLTYPEPFSTNFSVVASVQAWANGAPNYGWGLTNASTDGYRWDTSETSAGIAPRLEVSYRVIPAPLAILQQPPASQTVNERDRAVITVEVSGSLPRFQWWKRGLPDTPVAGGTSASLVFASVVPANAGTYYCVISNSLNVLTSQDSILNVIPDGVQPTVLGAMMETNETIINVYFSEPMEQAAAENTGNYTVDLRTGGGALTVLSAVLNNGTNVTLTTDPRVFGQNYKLRVQNLTDTAVALNVLNPNPTIINLPMRVLLLTWHTDWKFNRTDNLDGQPWTTLNYGDSAWPNGPAALGFDDTAATLVTITNVTGDGLLTQFPNPLDTNIITYYYRAKFNWPYDGTVVTPILHHLIDDGAVFHLNGAEVLRYAFTQVPPTPITYTTLAQNQEATLRTTNLNAILESGDNILAVEVHQTSATSSDTVFALELLGELPTFGPPRPKITLTYDPGTSQYTLSWAPAGGTLLQSDFVPRDPSEWTVAPNQGNPQTFTIGAGTRFFQVRQ
jgi:hypothetical protein